MTIIDTMNCDCETESTYRTVAQLRTSMMRRLGFSAQAANPPTGMSELLLEFLQDAQKQLYQKTPALRTERWYGWELVADTRFYGITENDNTGCTKTLNEYKISAVAIEDSNSRWYNLIQGIPPSFYTNVDFQNGLPSRYEVRSCIEIFPSPVTHSGNLWVKGHFGLEAFSADSDRTTIDDHLVFLLALGNAKAHYGQRDAQGVLGQLDGFLKDIKAGKHMTARYIPGSRPRSPMVRPTMTAFDDE